MLEVPLEGQWNYPTRIIAGAGSLGQLAAGCSELGIQRPLLVTDAALAALPMVAQAQALCRESHLQVGLYDGVKTNPAGQSVADGLGCYREGGHDGVIGLGGGSALDVAKTIALMAGQTLPLWSFEDVGDNWTHANAAAIAPVLAIPTTAGTGSEVGRASVITDEVAQVKRIIFHPAMLPGLVILDPELTVGLPPHITAATGIDALAHSLEALCAPSYHPMAQGIALEGMRLVHDYLPRAVANGRDIEARMQMLVASTMGATAFQKGLGAIHALAHPLGALYNAHHGLLNAIIMPYVLQANRPAIEPALTLASRYLGLQNPGFDSFLGWVLALREEVGIPNALASIGIDAGEADRVAAMAVADPSAAGNPLPFSADEYSAIFIRAVAGEL